MFSVLTGLYAGIIFLAGVAPGAATASELSLQAEYEELQARSGVDAGAEVRLALWCEEHGLEAERRKHLARAVLIEPGNVLARGLSGYVAHQGRWLVPEKIGPALQSEGQRGAVLAEYNARRETIAERTALAQSKVAEMEARLRPAALSTYRAERNRDLAMDRLKLGLWCEEAGLPTEAKVEFTAAVLLDTRVDDAWKHLGYVRHGGHWMPKPQADAERAEAKVQAIANGRWEPILQKWKTWLRAGDPRLSGQAEEQLTKVTDPRAVVAVSRVFWGPPENLTWAIRILRQIDTPASTQVLARVVGYTDSEDVRALAVECLKTRPTQHYLETLVDFIHTPARFSIEPVEGPGSRGVLVVDTPRYHIERSYDAPLAFSLGFPFFGYVGYDVNGLPVAVRGRELEGGMNLEKLAAIEQRTAALLVNANLNAMRTQEQIRYDAHTLELANAETLVINSRVGKVLQDCFAAPDLGDDEVAWHGWYFDRVGYSYTPPPQVNLTQSGFSIHPPSLISCFAGGTLVRTLDGPRPIERILPGDWVLSQNVGTGALAFRAVLVAHHNPPCQTVRLILERGEVLLPSIYHRFWITGKGWAMARDLKAGDTIRIRDGRAKVESVEPGEVVPVFNLTVEHDQTYFVGKEDCLVHDNTLPGCEARPFDVLTPPKS